MAEKLIFQSNFSSSDSIRLREYSFDKEVFTSESSEERLVKGLFDCEEVISKTDLWDIKDKAVVSPEPLKDSFNNLSLDDFCERPAYVPIVENSYVYPLNTDYKNGIYRIKTEDFIGSVPITKEKLDSSKERMVDYNTLFKSNKFNTDYTSYYLGMSSSSSMTINLLKYNEGEKDWSNNWFTEEGVDDSYSNINPYAFISKDVSRISPIKGKDQFFEKNLQLTEGKYCFSFFSKLYDTIYSKAGDKEIEILDRRFSEENKTSKILVQVIDKNSSSLIREKEIDVDSQWKRNIIKFSVEVSSEYSIRIIWKKESDKSLPLEICGFLLEKSNSVSAYDKSIVRYDDTTVDEIYHPIVILFKEGTSTNISKHPWTLNYKKFIDEDIDTLSEYDSLYVDTLGTIQIGFKGNKFFIKAKDKDPVFYEGTIEKFININLSIFIEYNGSDTIKVTVFNETNDSISLELSLTSTEMSKNLEAQVVEENTDTKLKKSEKVQYHLLLGGVSPKNLNSGYYFDVIYIPVLIGDTEIEKMNKSFFSVSLSSLKFERDVIIDPSKESYVEISWEDFKNLSSAIIEDKYKIRLNGEEVESYKDGDILVCYNPFRSKIKEQDIPFYWTRTFFRKESSDAYDQSVIKSSLIVEGYENIYKRNNKEV